ncbi:MAG: hypothetical protein LH647_05875 [Leptolyngbyaceae cyanobacterium CAN_BIN12]|nr:hypothetical protein [Leptolyngbyaceae cyanobacterium CAN_BIN12]
MSEKLDNFTNGLRDKLNDINARLSSVGGSIKPASKETQAAIESKLYEVKVTLETKHIEHPEI